MVLEDLCRSVTADTVVSSVSYYPLNGSDSVFGPEFTVWTALITLVIEALLTTRCGSYCTHNSH